MDFFPLFSFVFLVISVLSCDAQEQSLSFPITKYGAQPGEDATQAVMSAFKAACAAKGPSEVVVPKGKFLLSPAEYEGTPCKSPIKFVLEGTLQQPKTITSKLECWMDFRNVQYLTVTGGGVLDGKGEDRWGQPQCKKDPKQESCRSKLKNLCLFNSNNTVIEEITSLNSKGGHLNIYGCGNSTVQRVTITAPDESPNTDGIHYGACKGCQVMDSIIGTGDDCIGIVDDVTNLKVTNITCGPGHGISIGSLGNSPTQIPVSRIHVENCTFLGTSNGVRIKSWPGRYKNAVSNVSFINMRLENVSYAIVIDQTYGTCIINQKCEDNKGQATVVLEDIVFKDIKGTTREPESIILNCLNGGCNGVKIGDIDLKYIGTGRAKLKGVGGGRGIAKCLNVKPTVTGPMNPPCSSS